MAEEFTPITTPEAFEAAVADRLAPFADYSALKDQNAALTGQVADLTAQVADLTSRCQAYETDALKARIAHEVGIPFELAQRLTGTAEADIRKDAAALVQMLRPKAPPAPLRGDPDPVGGQSAWRAFTNQLLNNE